MSWSQQAKRCDHTFNYFGMGKWELECCRICIRAVYITIDVVQHYNGLVLEDDSSSGSVTLQTQ